MTELDIGAIRDRWLQPCIDCNATHWVKGSMEDAIDQLCAEVEKLRNQRESLVRRLSSGEAADAS